MARKNYTIIVDTKTYKQIDLSKKLKPHENQWIVISPDYKKVIAATKTLSDARKQAEQYGKEYLFVKLPPFDAAYVPTGR